MIKNAQYKPLDKLKLTYVRKESYSSYETLNLNQSPSRTLTFGTPTKATFFKAKANEIATKESKDCCHCVIL